MAANRGAIDTHVDIVTPENVTFHYNVAGPFRRILALLVDFFLISLVIFALSFAIGTISPVLISYMGEFGQILQGMMFMLLLILTFILTWFCLAGMEILMRGQTLGKKMAGLRVVTTDGRPVAAWQSLTRNGLRLVDLMPIMFEVQGIPLFPTGVLGILCCSLNRRFQRIGDLVAGTMVIVEEREWSAGLAKLEDPRTASLAQYIPANFEFSRDLALAISNYVERRKYFSKARRREIARHVAEPLLGKFGLPADTSYDLLMCALYYRAFVAEFGADQPAGDQPKIQPLPPTQQYEEERLPTIQI
jgi:uncharacterized RDD family membrane protein YckC